MPEIYSAPLRDLLHFESSVTIFVTLLQLESLTLTAGEIIPIEFISLALKYTFHSFLPETKHCKAIKAIKTSVISICE